MNVLVTGATGFIGGHLLPRLINTGHTVVCLARDPTALASFTSSNLRTVRGDVTDSTSVRQAISGCHAVVHLANVYAFWLRELSVYERVNVDGTRHVMEAALAANVRKVVHVSSAVTYGAPKDRPFTEDAEPGPLFSVYARTKRRGDELAWRLSKEGGMPLSVLYPGAVTGPGDTKSSGAFIRLLSERKMPARVLQDALFTWVSVTDVVTAILGALETEAATGQRYLIGNQTFTLGEIGQMVAQESGVPPPWLALPDWAVKWTAFGLTGLSRLTRRSPAWGLSVDQVRTTIEGFHFDGSKAERELGVRYTSVREAIKGLIAELRMA